MLCAAPIATLLVLAGPVDSPAAEFLAPYAGAHFPPPFEEALDAFLEVEAAYREGEYDQARAVLSALWDRYPAGGDAWPGGLVQPAGLNIGSPPCYYALRMYQDAVDWRLSLRGADPPTAHWATLTVVLVGHSHGAQPTTKAELDAGAGVEAVHSLDPLTLADDGAAIHESLELFREWVLAISGGRLAVRTRLLSLPDLNAPVAVRARPHRVAGLADDAMARIWSAVPADVLASTDWWWVLYPSHVPEQHPDFETMEFITGGMARGPDGASPCFLIDDRWLLRKPPHLGKGPYTSIERRAYLPQWVQHEFMHHVFARYPEFGLEDAGHQWFDRSTWPADFVGRFEPDYYHEAIHKRIIPSGEPPFHIALRYDAPDPELFAELRIEDLLGGYRRRPVENDWHEGSLTSTEGADGQTVLTWTNRAGVSWQLTPDLENGLLACDSGSPYYDSDPVGGRSFRLVLRRDEEGGFLAQPRGFVFGGGFYERMPDEPRERE